MVSGLWTFPVSDLGAALFEYVEVTPDELRDCGVLHADASILVALRVCEFGVENALIRATLDVVFQGAAAEEHLRVNIIDCPLEPEAFLRRVGNAIVSVYEKARAALVPASPSF